MGDSLSPHEESLRRPCKLEYEVGAGPIDPRILREFRDAMDQLRKTAWAVQEWQERQLRHHDPDTVLPLLTAEGIRRATQLCDAIIADTATHEVTRETGINEFFQAVERVHQTLLSLLKDDEA